MLQWACCKERHRHNGQDYHMAVKLEHTQGWISAKQYLKDKHGITMNFSNSHDNYYSATKYVTKEAEEVLLSADHPHLWNSKPPRTKRATEQSELGLSKQKKRKCMLAFELSQIIVENGITTRMELLAFATSKAGREKQTLLL